MSDATIEDWVEFRDVLPSEPPRSSAPYVLTNQTLRRVLWRYVMAEISLDQLAVWARTIRGRDDVEPEARYAALIREVVLAIASDPTFDPELAHTCADRLDWAQE